MNPDTNEFEMLQEIAVNPIGKMLQEGTSQLVRPNGEPVPQHWTQFQVGEHVVIKNYTFKVAYIGETAILFEPVGIVDIGNDEESKT